MSKTLNYIAPDGRKILLDASQSWFTNRCDATIIVQPARLNGKVPDQVQGRELHATFSGNYEMVAKDLLDAVVDQRLTVPGGEFVVYRSVRKDVQGVAVWRGPHHEIGSWLPPVAESQGLDPWDRFSGLEIRDTPDGILVGSTAESSIRVRVTDVSNYVEGVGMLYFYPPAEALGRVPAFRGKALDTGELWKTTVVDPDVGEIQKQFILANAKTVLALVPEPDPREKYVEQLNFLESLSHVEGSTIVRKVN